MRFFLALFIFSTSAFAQGQDFGRNLAREAFDNFRQINWGSVGRAANGPGYIAGPSAPGWNDADGLACFRYRSEYREWERNTDYYAFDPASPACRLLRVRITTAELKPEIVTVIYDLLRDALDRQYGTGRDPGKVNGMGSAYWAYLRQWESKGLRILLFVRTPPAFDAKEPRVEILAEHRDVLQTREREEAIRPHTQRVDTGLTSELDRAVAAEVGDVLPKLTKMLSGEPFDEGTIRATMQILVNVAAQATGERRGAMLFALDRLAMRLAQKFPEVTDRVITTRLETTAKIPFVATHNGWGYKHAVLDRLVAELPNTRWGEAAFVTRQDATEYCEAKPVHFPDVISKSERFLREHAASPYRSEALFQLAQADEDWWNAEHPVGWTFVPDAKYAPREEEMRRKSVDAYEQLLAAEPQSIRGRWAVLRLPRLKLKLHTNWFRFVDSCS